MTGKFTSQQKAVLTIGALLLLFVAPFIAAWSLYASREPVLQTVNYGTLLTPSVALGDIALKNTDGSIFPPDSLRGHWLLFYLLPATCSEASKNKQSHSSHTCQKNLTDNLYKMRQVRLALGKDEGRIQRMLLSEGTQQQQQLDAMLESQYTGTFHAVIAPQALKVFDRSDNNPVISATQLQQEGGMFLADPLGNVILYYQPTANAKDILKDLTRLLRVSQIG